MADTTDTENSGEWVPAPLPDNEKERLAALYRYDVLDTEPEPAFERITRLASNILGMPIALVSFIDTDRQWFKSRRGFDLPETDRKLAFCAHVILGNEVVVVPNATKDPRFYGHPAVTGTPDIRFYAGAPLTTADGLNLGTLCVVDMKPHDDFGQEKIEILSDLAALVIDALELRSSIRRANFANRSKSKFIANMSHEIRTPLNVIMGFTSMLADSPLSLEQRNHVQNIRVSGDTLLGIVNDVLDISKIEAGKLELEHTSFNIRGLLDEVANMFSIKAAEKYLPVITEIESDMPMRVMGDPHRVRQVLMNLISNAIKFTAHGHVKISAAYDHDNQLLYCSVEDTGIGIKPEKLESIFEDFAQADMSTTRQYGGTGLGLAICQRLMQLMDSKLELESNLGQGSCFSFALKLPMVAEDISSVSPAVVQAPIKAHVLVVEDMLFNQKVAKYTLEKIGCTVELADSGHMALEMTKRNHYDAIFMDVQMPELDGRQTTRLIREREKSQGEDHRLIIAMTASALVEDRQACLDSGMDDFTSKPLRVETIYTILKTQLGQ